MHVRSERSQKALYSARIILNVIGATGAKKNNLWVFSLENNIVTFRVEVLSASEAPAFAEHNVLWGHVASQVIECNLHCPLPKRSVRFDWLNRLWKVKVHAIEIKKHHGSWVLLRKVSCLSHHP